MEVIFINYENELSSILRSNLMDMYSISSEGYFAPYFYLRLMMDFDICSGKDIEERDMASFVIKELNLPFRDKKMIYKDECISSYTETQNSIMNIMADWKFRDFMHDCFYSGRGNVRMDEYLTLTFSDIRKQTEPKVRRNGKIEEKSQMIAQLNQYFNVKRKSPPMLVGVSYPKEHNFFQRTVEEIHLAHIHALSINKEIDGFLPERELETYLIKNLSLIEDGLLYIDSQKKIKEGRIDILAKDKLGTYVVIELKTEIDKDVIWQSIYYPQQMKKELKTKKIRMIVIMPKCPDHILEPLKLVGDTEIFTFRATTSLSQIIDLHLQKIA